MPLILRTPRAALLAVLGAALLPVPATAATVCSVSGASLSFGSFALIGGLDPASDPNHDSATDIVLTCSGAAGTTVAVEVQLDGGTAGNPLARRLSGPNLLAYNIYTDPSRTQVWGDGASGAAPSATMTIAEGSTTASATLPAYGRIPAGQRSAQVGTYADNVLVTIVY